MTDQEILSEMQRAVLEVPDGGATWPSEAWTRDEALEALNTNLQQLVRETHLLATRAVIAVPLLATAVSLPTDWMATLDVVWQAGTGVRTPLGSLDAYEVDLADPTWNGTGEIPLGYLDRDQASQTLRLAPAPAPGNLELLYCPRPPTCTGNGVTLSPPQDYCYGAKWGALSTLLSKVGRMQDPERAQYCRQRYDLVKMAADLVLKGSYA